MVDELVSVEEWSADMKPVLVDELYEAPYLQQLNRFLRLQQGWLLQHVLRPPGNGGRPR
jgi:hypothetical protein